VEEAERPIEEEKEESEAFGPLTATAYAQRIGVRTDPRDPPLWLILVQVLAGFAAIVVGAELFAGFIDRAWRGSACATMGRGCGWAL